MRAYQRKLGASVIWLTTFILWTYIVCNVDVQPIGPRESAVGLAAVNQYIHNLTGVHFAFYTVTDWLGLVPIAVCVGFAILGLSQWIKRKRLGRVDRSLLVLGGFYMAVIAAYAFFEVCVVNYRPVLIEGVLEASYPSSTTTLVMCVMPTAMMQLNERIRNGRLKQGILFIMALFTAFMVVGRLISGVHWFSDIVGGGLLSAGLVTMCDAVKNCG